MGRMSSRILILFLFFAHLEKSLIGGGTRSRSKSANAGPPTEEEVQATLEAAITLRRNIITTLSSFLRNPDCQLTGTQRTAFEDIHNGFKTNAIDTLDLVANMQKYYDVGNQDQVLTLLNRLQKTVGPRYLCAVDVAAKAIENGDVHISQYSPKPNALLKNVTKFKQEWLDSKWFSRVSDTIARYGVTCNRQFQFYNMLMEAFRRSALKLNTKVFTNLMLNINFQHMPSDIRPIFNYISKKLAKKSYELDPILSNVDARHYDDLHEMVSDILNAVAKNAKISDFRFLLLIAKVLPYISPDGPEVGGTIQYFTTKQEVDYKELFSTCSQTRFPVDILQACKAILDSISNKTIKISTEDVLAATEEETNTEKALAVLLRHITLNLPISSPMLQYLQSLIEFMSMKWWNENGVVHMRKNPGEVVSLMDTFQTLNLSSDFVRILEDVKSLLIRAHVDWYDVFDVFPFHLYTSPRLLFIEILKWVLKSANSSFTQHDVCYITKFINDFNGYNVELGTRRFKNVKRDSGGVENVLRRSRLKSTKGAKCIDNCPTRRSYSTTKTKHVGRRNLLIPFKAKMSLFNPMLHRSSRRQIQALQKGAKLKTLASDRDEPENQLEKYTSSEKALRMFKNSDYGAFNTQGEALRKIIMRETNSTGKMLLSIVDKLINNIEHSELPNVSNSRTVMQDETLTNIFMSIKQDNLLSVHKVILKKLLRYFTDLSLAPQHHTLTNLQECPSCTNIISNACIKCLLNKLLDEETFSISRSEKETTIPEKESRTEEGISTTETIEDEVKSCRNSKSLLTQATSPTILSTIPLSEAHASEQFRTALPTPTVAKECTRYTSLVLNLSGKSVDMLILFDALPRLSLPLKYHVILQEVKKLFLEKRNELEEMLQDLEIQKYATKGSLLSAIFKNLQTKEMYLSQKEMFSLLSKFITTEGAGGEPI